MKNASISLKEANDIFETAPLPWPESLVRLWLRCAWADIQYVWWPRSIEPAKLRAINLDVLPGAHSVARMAGIGKRVALRLLAEEQERAVNESRWS